MGYIDAEKLKVIIKSQIKERKEWMKDIDKSDRQDQLWSDLNGEDISILQIINSLQQEQSDVNLEKEIDMFVDGWSIDEYLGLVNDEGWSVTVGDIKNVARHFYELGRKGGSK